MISKRAMFAGVAALCCTGAAIAAETITIIYDAKGRVVRVAHSGAVNNGVTTNYAMDPADNRIVKQVTGAP